MFGVVFSSFFVYVCVSFVWSCSVVYDSNKDWLIDWLILICRRCLVNWRHAGEFRREDLARTVLNYVVKDLVQTTKLFTSCHAITRVFFSGGVCSTPLVRSAITEEFARSNMWQYIQGQVGYVDKKYCKRTGTSVAQLPFKRLESLSYP